MTPAPRRTEWRTTVEFGDCDPAGIAFYPNFLRWYDASTRHFFHSCGVPPWRELERTDGIIGTPVVEATLRYVRPVSYGDVIAVTTWVDEWRERSFVLRHELRHEANCAPRAARCASSRPGATGTARASGPCRSRRISPGRAVEGGGPTQRSTATMGRGWCGGRNRATVLFRSTAGKRTKWQGQGMTGYGARSPSTASSGSRRGSPARRTRCTATIPMRSA